MSGLSDTVVWTLVSLFGAILLFSLILNITVLKLSFVVLSDNLRHPKFRHFLTSLLLGNLFVTLSGLPTWIAILITRNTDETETISDMFYYTLDIFHSLLVFIHIIVVMIERLLAIGWSIQHRISPDRHDYLICCTIWLTTGILTTAAFLVYYFYNFKLLSVISAAVCFLFPLLLSCILFVAIIVKKKRNYTTEMRRIEYKIALVVARVMFVCFLLHAPLHTVHSLIYTFSAISIPREVTMMFLRCVQYSNSIFIPLVFMLGLEEFRSELQMCCYKCCAINEHSRSDIFQMDLPRLDSGKCILTNASSVYNSNSRSREEQGVQLSFTNEVQ